MNNGLERSPVRTAIVGFGLSARVFHLPLIGASEQFDLVAICSSQSEAIARLYPGVASFTEPQQLLDECDAELVIITAPNAVHFSLAAACLSAGRNVVLEKPITITLNEAHDLVQQAEAERCLLSVFHNRRWDGDFLTVKQLLEDDTLGRITLFESCFDRFRPQVKARWKENAGPGNGNWYDLGPHLIDQSLQLFGRPQALTARCLQQRQGAKATDYFNVQLHYAHTEVLLRASSHNAAPNMRFQIHGSRGSYRKYGLDPQEEQLKGGMPPADPHYGREPKPNYGHVYDADNDRCIETLAGCYPEYYRQLAAALRSGAPNPVSAEAGAAVVEILELAELSSKTGNSLVLE